MSNNNLPPDLEAAANKGSILRREFDIASGRVRIYDTTGAEVTLVSGAVPVSLAGTTLPLPTGAATETTLSAAEVHLTNIDAYTGSVDGKITACNTGAVTVATSALPTGAATETTLGTVKTNTDTLVASGGGGYVRQDTTATIAKESGGNLATVKTNTDPLVASGGGGYVRQDSTATIAKESGGNLASVKTNTDPFVASGAGGYVRQDSTGTIAKETGGNLAAAATSLAAIDTNTDAEDTNFWKTVQLGDKYGWRTECTPMDEARVVVPTRLTGSTFTGATLDTNFWTPTVANGGTATVGSGQLLLKTSTNTAGTAYVLTSGCARYVGGSANRFRAQVQLGDTGVANSNRWWGVLDPALNNGAYFQLTGTAMSIITAKAGTFTTVASAAWNGSTTVPTLTNPNNYEIYYTNRYVYFVCNGILLHTVTADAATWTAETNLCIYLHQRNAGNNTDLSMAVRVATIYRLGAASTQPKSYYQAGTTAGVVLKYGAGNIRNVNISGVNNNAVVTLYDNTAASGTVIWSSGTMASNAVPFPVPMYETAFSTGLTLVISGANANAQVIYE